MRSVYWQFLALTSNYYKTNSQTENSDFIFLPPKDPPASQPNIEGLIPIIMTVARMTLLASSTLSSLVVSSFELLEDAHSLPLDVLFSRRNTTSHSRQSRPQLTRSFFALRSQYPIFILKRQYLRVLASKYSNWKP